MKNSTLIIRSLAVIAVFSLPIFASYGESDAEKNKSTEMNDAYYCDSFRISRDVKIAFLGNSITLHNPKDSLGWTNRCGMAASSSAKDYVHLVADGVSRITSRGVDVRVKNLALFERDYRNRDVASDVGEIIAFKPDILVVALGENVPGLANEDDKRAYGAAFSRLLALFRKDTRSPFIVVRGVFWPNRAKDEAMEMAARENGAVFVKADISHDKRNMALGLFSHQGVARHPGDEGMAEIAKRILSPIEKELQSVPTPFKVYLDEAGAGSIGSVLFDFADGSLACGAKGFYRKSLDGGRTWKTMYPMAPGFGASRGSNIIRLKDGRLMCMINEPCENILTNSLKASNFYVSFSSDEGRTWKGRVPLSSDNRRLYLMNDRFVRLSTGRILVPFSLHPNELLAERLESVGWVNAFYSDDEGATWREGTRRPTKTADQMCEPVVFERKDGVLVMFARTGMGYLYRCESKDGGESWSEERPSPLRSAVSPFAMKKDPLTGYVFAAWNNSFPAPVHQYPRSPFSFAVSRDDGDTWEFICDIENDPMSSYGYPAIHFTKDSVLVVYYEQKGVRHFEQKAQRCKLAIFDRAELTVEKRQRERFFVRGPLKDFRFGDDGTLTFLMLADWHLGAMSLDVIKKHVAGFKAVIHENKPSFIVLAGDNLSTRKNAVGQFERLMTPFVELLKETRTPLCVTFGNHDSESTPANPGYYSRQAQYDWLKSRLGELFVDHDVPELSGVGTGVIPIYATAPGKAAFKVYVVDSGDYPARAGNGLPSSAYGWDNPRSDQIAWYMRESADKVPHVYIQHIIVPDILVTGLFEPAKEKEEGAFPFDKTLFPEDKVEKGGGRYFWMKPGARLMTSPDAKCNERPCPPRWNTYTDVYHTVGGTTLYNAWIKSRCMKGAFFGHDHSNSFDAVDDNGIRFGGCVVFNWGAYRVFKIREDGTYETWLKRMIIE